MVIKAHKIKYIVIYLFNSTHLISFTFNRLKQHDLAFTNIDTHTFYVTVYAFENYTDGDLMIEGIHLAGVVKVDHL